MMMTLLRNHPVDVLTTIANDLKRLNVEPNMHDLICWVEEALASKQKFVGIDHVDFMLGTTDKGQFYVDNSHPQKLAPIFEEGQRLRRGEKRP